MDFCIFKHLYLAMCKVEISEIFSISSQTSLLEDITVTCIQIFFSKFGICTRNGNFGALLVKT